MLLYGDLDTGHISGICSGAGGIEGGQHSGICIWHGAIRIGDADIDLDYINSTLYTAYMRGGGTGDYNIDSGLD